MSRTRREKVGDRRPVQRRAVLRMDERGRQVTRLLDLLRALEKAKRGLSVRQIMEELDGECSQRTVYRDLEHLRAAGFHVVSESGKFRLDGPTLDSDALRPSQVLALLLALDATPSLSGFGVRRELVSLSESLRARLTPEGRGWIDLMRATVVSTTNAPEARMDERSFEAIEDSLFNEELLEIEYGKANENSETRIVEPHLLLSDAGRSYLVAYCRKAEDFRNFALQRIRSARLGDGTFEKRPDFERDEYVQRCFGVFQGPAHSIALKFSKEVAHLTAERRFHATQKVERLADGSTVLHMTVGGLPEIAAWVAGFGGKMQVLAPEELRRAVEKIHREGLAANGTADARGRDPSNAETPLPSSGVDLRDTARETPDSRKIGWDSGKLTSGDKGEA